MILSYRNTNITNNRLFKINEVKAEDVRTKLAKEFSFFPMAEKRLFPSRDPRATGWQIGLREDFGWDDDRNKDLAPAIEEEDKTSPEYRSKQRAIYRRHLTKKAASINMLKKDSIYAETRIAVKKAPVQLEKLPTVTKEVKQKYFGLASKQMFFETYHDLREKG